MELLTGAKTMTKEQPLNRYNFMREDKKLLSRLGIFI